ncbi:MAG TPA: NAD-dependent epimerase/dehydratase family protein [Flavobacteriales bacterium]|nr:NAD-dependent epimerase/dehydratase family protein [Flavobacteriales bacterium]
MDFVTGGTGLLGANLIYELIRQEKDVVAIKRPTSDLSVIKGIFDFHQKEAGAQLFEKIKWMDGDILDIHSLLDSIEKDCEVYHCAAMVSFNPRAREKMMKVNVEGTANVVNACLEKKVKKLCFASSVASIGIPPKDILITENAAWKSDDGKSNYSISKYESEKEVWRGIEEGLNAVIVNPTIIVGPGNWKRSSARMFHDVWSGLKFYTSGANGFVDVRDVATVMIKLMKHEVSGERFILNGDNLPFKEVFGMIADALEKPRPNFLITPFLAEMFWRFEKIRSFLMRGKPLITKEIARESNNKSYYSTDKIRQLLEVEFFPIAESVNHAASVFLQQKNN